MLTITIAQNINRHQKNLKSNLSLDLLFYVVYTFADASIYHQYACMATISQVDPNTGVSFVLPVDKDLIIAARSVEHAFLAVPRGLVGDSSRIRLIGDFG